jgi:hypothetical protein
MKVLVSGATGLIGSALQRALVARGDQVITLIRPSTSNASEQTIHWDPSLGTIDRAALERQGPIDAVIHLAGAGIADKRWTAARKEEILSSRVNSTRILADAVVSLSHQPEVFVSGSAIGIYGNRGDEILTESSSEGSGFLADVCHAWEAAASAVPEAGIRTAFARTGIVLSAEGGALAKQLPLFRLGVGGRLGSGKQWTSWISIDDEVAGILAILDQTSLAGPINLTAPSPVTNAEFTRALGHALHRPAVLPVPVPALKVALGSELVDEALTASQRVEPTVLLASGFRFTDPEINEGLASILS